jgi:diguanylate cyclase (GGDEF)-like protein
MHRSATHLLQRVVSDLPISVGELDQFNNRLDQLRLELESLRRELTDALENRDPLTDARNRSTMLPDLREQQALVRRGLQVCTLVMIDLDDFKTVNDRYGHLAGDAVLRAIARCLERHMRSFDRLYRYGGEEFLLCTPQTSVADAVELAERLRAEIADLNITDGTGGQKIRTTASFGVSEFDDTLSVEEAIERADAAMYTAKAAGRNRVARFGMTPRSP